MTYTTNVLEDGTAEILMSFQDEGVDLSGRTTVKGGAEEAQSYVGTFERDLRTNYSHLFPQPEPEEVHEEEEMS